jgi:hypothetical protein
VMWWPLQKESQMMPRRMRGASLKVALEVPGRVVDRICREGIRKCAGTDVQARRVREFGHVADMVEMRVAEDEVSIAYCDDPVTQTSK